MNMEENWDIDSDDDDFNIVLNDDNHDPEMVDEDGESSEKKDLTEAGVEGQVCPPVAIVPNAGRGMQKGFYQSYGMPAFTLPPHRTIYEVDIDAFEQKPWRLDGADISDFFNFGLTEESWKCYCNARTNMQGRNIRVYESGRAEQEYELAAAATRDVQSESTKLGRPSLPIGRPIQVEIGNVERLPSTDTRKPRISDVYVIIEIVCHDFVDEDDDTKKNDEITPTAASKDMIEKRSYQRRAEDIHGRKREDRNDTSSRQCSKLGTKRKQETELSRENKSDRKRHRADIDEHGVRYKEDGSFGRETNNVDSVEKLKKRSERFKVSMRSEKEATSSSIKKMDCEPLPSRPSRKRRWGHDLLCT